MAQQAEVQVTFLNLLNISKIFFSYGVRCWYAHGPHELRNMTGLTGNSVGATSTTASDAESPVPNSDLPLQLMPPTDSLSVMTLPNSFETQLSLITSPTQSAPPPYAAIQPNPIQPPMQHFNRKIFLTFKINFLILIL